MGWDFNNIWYIDEGSSYPILRYQFFGFGSGTSVDPYIIKTPEQLNNMRLYVGSAYSNTYWKLANDIDLSSYLTGSEGRNPIGAVICSMVI